MSGRYRRSPVAILGMGLLLSSSALQAQETVRQPAQAVEAPAFRVDPFWPKPLPNRWSMQQVTGCASIQERPHLVPESRGRCGWR